MDRSDRSHDRPLTGHPLKGRRTRARVDRELEAGALAHYDDPIYYTSTYAQRIEDVACYVDLALQHGGPVLEYGIGNGRIALPLARHGMSVTGIDHSRPMLADLKERLLAEAPAVRKRVKAKYGDMRKVRLGKKFPLVICPFTGVLHLYTRPDVEAFLARVREHLAPGGTFVADLSIPMAVDLARDPAQPFKTPRFRHPTAGVVRYTERFDYEPTRQVLFITMEFEPLDGGEAFATPLAHRQFFPLEWEALLHYNGFEIVKIDGDFQGGALQRGSDVMVVHAKRRKR